MLAACQRSNRQVLGTISANAISSGLCSYTTSLTWWHHSLLRVDMGAGAGQSSTEQWALVIEVHMN